MSFIAWPTAAFCLAMTSVVPLALAQAEDAYETSNDEDFDTQAQGYSPPPAGPSVVATGYVDIGFVDAQGDGTSWAPNDTRLPADYGVDPFATAVNSRGDAASTDANGRFTNGFLPRSAGVGGRPSFLLNTVSTDLRVSNASGSYLLFVRAQAIPRFTNRGDNTRLFVEQAFARIIPFASQELAITVGRADSVFGVEYLDNQANLRTGITPSLMARYTTGTPLGIKMFYRRQFAALWSALSVNIAATNGSPMAESLQTQSASLSGRPVISGRIGWESNLPALQIKLGASGLQGPRNDQRDPKVQMRLWGVDARLLWGGLALSAEYTDVRQDEGGAEKLTPLAPAFFASGFWARGFWTQLAFSFPWTWGWVGKVTPYARLGHRRAGFEGFGRIEVARLTAGVRVDVGENVALKGEWLFNRERMGAPAVDNDVRALSAVFTW